MSSLKGTSERTMQGKARQGKAMMLTRYLMFVGVGMAWATTPACSTSPESSSSTTGSGIGDTTSGTGAGGAKACELATAATDCDDSNDCTNDECLEGSCAYHGALEGTVCGDGVTIKGWCLDGECEAGSCIDENPDLACDDGNSCTTASCDSETAHCVYSPLDGIPVPGFPQTEGDCALVACVDGHEMIVSDNEDVPDDGNDCTEDRCEQGSPTSHNFPANTPCGQGQSKVCDGNGNCT